MNTGLEGMENSIKVLMIQASSGTSGISGMGVAMKINTVTVYVQLGLGTGIQPLIGYNYGAGNKKDYRMFSDLHLSRQLYLDRRLLRSW